MQKKLTNNSLKLLRKNYFRDEETDWPDLSKRVSKGVAMAEESSELRKQWQKQFYEMIVSTDFIPSTPCLLNADQSGTGQLSSCFIIELRDNIESIYKAKGECAKIFQKNGGVGFNTSVLRPDKSSVETSGGYSCGVLGFMEEFNLTADVVTRNNSRKGAIKIDLNDWHPDILKFIHAKDDTTKLTFMNISVSLSDRFMDAVKKDLYWELKFPDYTWNKAIYNQQWTGDLDSWEAAGYPVKVYDTVKAKWLYHEIMEHAHRTGEPGVSFRDSMNRANPNPHLGKVNSTNPCSEFTSVPYNSCNLGSMNLLNCVNEDGSFNWEKLGILTQSATRFLDDMITVNNLPLKIIEDMTKRVRSVGLGVMGFGHMFYKMGMRYNSPEAMAFAEELFKFISSTAFNYSVTLAEEKGVYPAWEGSIWHQAGIRIRNSNFLSIAPTGSISFIANVSGGIEPVFALVYTRRTNDGELYYIVDPVFQEELIKRGLYSEKLLEKIVEHEGSCQGIDEVPKDMQYVFVTAHDIGPFEHTDMVGVIQKSVDLSISKTVNLAKDVPVETIEDVYMYAHSLGCKGITVYRNGSRENQTLAVKRDTPDISVKSREGLSRGDWKRVAADTVYEKRKIHIGCGKITLFIGWSELEKSIQDLYIKRSGQGGCERNLENMVIAMSGMLRLGGSLFNIEKAFEGVGGCNSFVLQRAKGQQLSRGNNCGNAVLNEIKAYLDEKHGIEPAKALEQKKAVLDEVAAAEDVKPKNKCPECGEPILNEGGCIVCKGCGYSKCS